MQFATSFALGLSSASFAFYGISCFVWDAMVPEFERYQLGRFRRLTGGLQVAASIGLIAGYWYPPLLVVSAGGLAAMMVAAMIVRLRIRDPLYAMIPAFAFFCLNLFIVVAALSVVDSGANTVFS